MQDVNREQLLTALIAAPRSYRDLVHLYQIEQVEMLEHGLPMADLVVDTFDHFTKVQRAEIELFAVLDALDVHEFQ